MEAGLLTRPRAGARPLLSARALVPACLLAITGLAAVLRFWAFASVPPNPFYDAAVRSMSQSWHNFFFGAVEPSGQVSIDKIPVDLWVQVASAQLFGFSSVAMRLPEALAGVLAVPLLYDLVRRLYGRTAGLVAACALAVLPVAVLTARSDTMDSLMMLLDVLAAWLVVWGAQKRTAWPFVAAGAVMGLAFNVKLFEALMVLPALGLLALLAVDLPLRRRAAGLAGGLVAFVGVAVAWVAAAGMTPLGSRPWPIGSTNGGTWNVVFVFNGTDRLTGSASAAGLQLDPPGPLRFLSTGGHAYAGLVGSTLLAALVFGVLALVLAMVLRRASRLEPAGAVFLGVWLLLGVGLLSYMQRFQPRYLEAVSPAIAAVLGAGIGWLAAHAERLRAAAFALAGGAGVVALAAVALVHPAVWAGVAALGAAVLALALASRGSAALLAACATVAALAVPAATAVSVAGSPRSDAGLATPLPPAQVGRLSRYLLAHQGSRRYEVASTTVFKAGPLIVRDGRPVLFLTSYLGRPLLTPAQLSRMVATGRVKYLLSGGGRAPVERWARKHSVDVSRAAGVPRGTLARFRSVHG